MQLLSPPSSQQLANEAVAASDHLSIQVESAAVAFRLDEPETRFQLVEERLKNRDKRRFQAYAERRASAEARLPHAPIADRIAEAVKDSPELQSETQVLLSAELEVLMDLAFPVANTSHCYRSAINAGKPVIFTSKLPTSSLFVQMLLQKCGYEQFKALQHSPDDASPIPAPIELTRIATAYFPLTKSAPVPTNLAAHIVKGLERQYASEQLAYDVPADKAIARMIGFQLIGPSIAALLQASGHIDGTCKFVGLGSGYLTTLTQSLRHPWPWLPECTTQSGASVSLAIQRAECHLSLLPTEPASSRDPVFSIHHLQPGYLLLNPIREWFRLTFSGPLAPAFQQGAERFLRLFADASRGLYLPLPPDFLISRWRAFLLRPHPETLRSIATNSIFPDLHGTISPLRNLDHIKNGHWPSASYALAPKNHKRVLHLLAPARSNTISTHFL